MITRLSAAALLGLLLFNPATAAPLDPNDFSSLGTLPTGSFEIDTSALTFGGQAGGVLVSQGSGAPDIAVFTFDSGNTLPSGEAITVIGENALALLFQGSVTLSGTIDVSGGDGAEPVANVVTGIGGVGVAGGGNGGNGGPFSANRDGLGPGHGVNGSNSASVSGIGSGSGAGFGTGGGRGGVAVTERPGGLPYGDPLRDVLFAGSGGGGGGGQSNSRLGGGGGAGGGALEIGALTMLEFNGATILANGGNGANGFADGGAGSGGGILIHGQSIALDAATLLQANGGNGGSGVNTGGCGGAGRIELLRHPSGSFESLGTIEVLAGSINGDCTDGEHVVVETTEVGVPEPTALSLCLLSTLAMTSSHRRKLGG